MPTDLNFQSHRPAIAASDLQTRADQLLRTYTCRSRYHYGDCNCLEALWTKITHEIRQCRTLAGLPWVFTDEFCETIARKLGTGCYMGARPAKMWRSFLKEMTPIVRTVMEILTQPRTTGEGSCA